MGARGALGARSGPQFLRANPSDGKPKLSIGGHGRSLQLNPSTCRLELLEASRSSSLAY